jgi:colanic acid/amylovoran biosynthesis glycosyltransferase
MLRVTIVVPVFPKLSETFIVNKVVGLIDLGFDVRVLVQHRDMSAWRNFPALQSRQEIASRVIEVPERRGLGSIIATAWGLLTLSVSQPELLKRYVRHGAKAIGSRVVRTLIRDLWLLKTNPQLLHFEFGTLSVDRAEIGKWIGCKVVTSFRGYDLNYVGLEDPNFYLGVWQGTDAVHCLGQDLWKRAQRRGCPADKFHVLIPPSIDAQFFGPPDQRTGGKLGTPERPLRILSVGRLDWKKGHEYALMAIRMLLDRGVNAKLKIVGNGEYLEAVMFCRHQLGLQDYVEVLGGAPQSTVREEMRHADLFLHAAISEGFCNAVLEAQSMELPVVTSDADGLGENVVDGSTGFVVKRRDPRALADRMELLAADSDLRREMGSAGRRRVLKQFQLADQIQAFGKFYEAVVDETGSLIR